MMMTILEDGYITIDIVEEMSKATESISSVHETSGLDLTEL